MADVWLAALQDAGRHAEGIGAAETGDALEGRIDVQDLAVGVGDEDGVAGLLHGGEQAFALVLGLLAFGDVLDGADHGDDGAPGVEGEAARSQHPAHAAVRRAADAVFPVEGFLGPQHFVLEVTGHGGGVLRGDQRQPAFHGARVLGGDAQDLVEHFGGGPEAQSLKIALVGADGPRPLGFPEEEFAFPQGLLDPLAVGDDDLHAVPAGRAVRQALRHRGDRGPSHAAGGVLDPEFGAQGGKAADRVVLDLGKVGRVVRVHARIDLGGVFHALQGAAAVEFADRIAEVGEFADPSGPTITW